MKDGKYQIKLYNKIAKIGTDRFNPNLISYGEAVENPDGVLVRSAELNDMTFPENLLCIGRAGIGVNNIPVERCSEAGIVVFNTPGANANAVKELGICALLLASRKISDGIEWVKSIADCEDVAAAVEKGKSRFAGPEIKGKTLGVIGLGAIGVMIANIGYRLGMEVYGYDPYMTVEKAWTMDRHVHRVTSHKEIYENSDYITVHVPLNSETKHMINRETIAQMRDGVRIINLSRGGLVNDDDMAAALESGKVACYVTDFPNNKTVKMKNTVCTPHLGASTPESEDNCAVMAADELQNYLLYGNITNSVNMPDIEMPLDAKYRLFVIHRNVPNMVGIISTSFAGAGINIEHMQNRSKNDYACTMLDTNSEIPQSLIEKINNTPEMLRVRLIKRR
jgi:D-3-phosphoglycerate dehydrogenase